MLQAKLVVVGGDARAAEISLSLPTVIGRGRDVTLTLPHPLVSRRHCEIFERNGVLHVRDLDSLNGTYVDSQRIRDTCELRPHQLLTIGNVTFRAIYTIADYGTAAGNGKPAGTGDWPGDQPAGNMEETVLPPAVAAGSTDESLRDRKTEPGQQVTGKGKGPGAPDVGIPAAQSGDGAAGGFSVLDEGKSESEPQPAAAETGDSVVRVLRTAGIGRDDRVAASSLSEGGGLLPDVPRPAQASSIDGLDAGDDGFSKRDDNFTGIAGDVNEPARVQPDESALGSFIRKLPR